MIACTVLEAGTAGERSQCPLDMGGRDPELERVTADSLAGALVRLVGGYDPGSATWSRTGVSCQVFGGLELGFAHLARGNAAEALAAIATRAPDLAGQAWGDRAGELARNAADVVAQFNGRTSVPSGYAWLPEGWAAIAYRGEVGAIYADVWWREIVAPVTKWMQGAGLRQRRTLAAGVRLRNTSGAWLDKLKARVSSLGEAAGVTATLQEYGQPDRTAKINDWPAFQGAIDTWPEASDLPYATGPAVQRPILPVGRETLGGALSGVRREVWIGLGAAAGLAVVVGLAVYLRRGRRRR
jgi:hypothetical protein